MFRFAKQPGKDFLILNLTDIQMSDAQWKGSDAAYAVLDHTVRTLIDRVKPDLITVSGDIADNDGQAVYPAFGRYLDGFCIPWCTVWGNHDHNYGIPFLQEVVADYRASCKNFLFEAGQDALGYGNYLITVCVGERPIHALYMIDSHNRSKQPDENGVLRTVNDRLNAAQLVWYRDTALRLRAAGCQHSTVLQHIPIFAYNRAWDAAFDPTRDMTAISVKESYHGDCWREGYRDAFGVRYEQMPLGTYPHDDGVFALIKQLGFTQSYIAGHDHINNFCIPYQGVRLIYATHTGMGGYWHPEQNGGTVIAIADSGSARVYHEYVDVTPLL